MTSTIVRTGRGRPVRHRPLIMGILNVTPDSFSDGGQYFESTEVAVEHAIAMVEAGAEIIDVGGESTRPGAQRVERGTERERVLPVVEQLVKRGIRTSVDTTRASTAQECADLGAEFINDVSGGLADPEMYRTIAKTGVNYIAMHWRAPSAAMDEKAVYRDAVREVRTELKARIAELLVWGVDPAKIILDPGIGFSKNSNHNWSLLGHLDELVTIGCPVLIGASRKRFLADVVAEGEDRDPATAIVSVLSAQAGAWGVRVHDVPSTTAALDVWSAWERGSQS